MEIEKKYQVATLPSNLASYPSKNIEQGYLCANPTVRIRKCNEDYILTYKSKFGIDDMVGKDAIIHNEVEVLLNKEGYEHLKEKVDNHLISKTRYMIPLENHLTAELDIFEGRLKGLIFVEVEFEREEDAKAFIPPTWFGKDVTFDSRYKNGYLSTVNSFEDLGLD